jgi:hypothetical protein
LTRSTTNRRSGFLKFYECFEQAETPSGREEGGGKEGRRKEEGGRRKEEGGDNAVGMWAIPTSPLRCVPGGHGKPSERRYLDYRDLRIFVISGGGLSLEAVGRPDGFKMGMPAGPT